MTDISRYFGISDGWFFRQAFSTIVAEKERKEADVAQADWQRENDEAVIAEIALAKEANEATDADRALRDMQVKAKAKHKEALAAIKDVRFLDKEAKEAQAAAVIIQARFRGYTQRARIHRELLEARAAEAKAAQARYSRDVAEM